MFLTTCTAIKISTFYTGKGTISIAEQDDKKSFNLEKGDVFRLPAGTTLSFINRDNNEKFFVYALAKSGNAPGLLQVIIIVLVVHQNSGKVCVHSIFPRPHLSDFIGYVIVVRSFRMLKDLFLEYSGILQCRR